MSELTRTAPPEPALDQPDYKPISSLAIASAVTAGILAVGVAVILIASRVSGKPLVAPVVLVVAGIGWVTSVLAGWQIRKANGALGGRRLTAAAWWVCVLTGIGYAAFLAATELALRQQAREFTDQFLDLTRAGKLETAFARTLDAPVREDLDETDAEGLNARFGTGQLGMFRVNELIRHLSRYPDATDFEYRGVKSWSDTPTGYLVEQNYRVRNPEGQFDVVLTAFGSDRAARGRAWQIVVSRSNMQDRLYSRYGRLNWEVYNESMRFINEWLHAINDGKSREIYQLTRPAAERAAAPDAPAEDDYLKHQMILVDGKPAAGEEGRRYVRDMIRPNAISISPAGGMGFVQPTVEIEGDKLVLRFEIELSLSSSATVPATLVLEVTGPELVADMTKLRGGDWKSAPLMVLNEIQPKKAIDDYPKMTIRARELNVKPNAQRITRPDRSRPQP